VEWEKDVYGDSRVQALVSNLMGGDVHALHPIFDLRFGVRYPDVEMIVGEPPSDREFLERLYEAGILKRELYDMVVCCPSCASANASTRYCCPICKSFIIKRSSLIEHVKCGYMDVEEKFRLGGRLVCPKCHVKLTRPDVDYRRAGVWCTCKSCGKSFDIPATYHFCRECGQVFTFEEADFREAYVYSLNVEAVKDLTLNWTMFKPIRDYLESRGFNVESPGFLQGKSGVKHMFDIVAHDEGARRKVIAVNISTSTGNDAVQDQPVIEMFAKAFDSQVDSAFLIAIPKISETGRKLACLYKIKVVEAKNPEEAITKMEEQMLAER
jgi:hypothetical protein